MATEAPAAIEAGHPEEEIVRDRLYIGGEWVEPSGSSSIEVVDSTTEKVIGRVPEGTAEDIDRAAKAARAGFEAWSAVPLEQRTEACAAISAALAGRADELGALIAAEVGMPLALARTIQAGLPAMDFAAMPRAAGEVAHHQPSIALRVGHERQAAPIRRERGVDDVAERGDLPE